MLTQRERFMAYVDNDCLPMCDAIILLEGDGYNRYQHAVDLYNDQIAPRIVFSGNIINLGYGSFPFEDILPKLLESGVPRDAIYHENRSQNTREQALEIIRICKQLGWSRIVLVASADHQYRAYLTFLRVVIDAKSDVLVFNSSAKNKGWYKDDGWGSRTERLNQEFERIEKYGQMGHLATIEEAIEYQRWKEMLL